MDFCAEGADSKACQALTQASPLQHSDTLLQEMRDKHPLALRPLDFSSLALGAANVALAPSVDSEMVTKALGSFSKHAAAGPSGLSPFQVRQALTPANTDIVVQHLTSLTALLSKGRAHRDIAPWLAGATLHALPKKDGSARPIAVGEFLRRLVGKTLCGAYQEQAKRYLCPLQIGVAQPLGCEAGLQTVRQWMHRNRNQGDKVFIKLDFANAFNMVSRESFLQEVRNHMPGLAPWVDWTYGIPSKLVFGSSTLSSETGVQQGDPLGPLLFALALQPLLQELADQRAPGGLELVFSYLDDLCLAGNSQAVANAVAALRTKAATVGLSLSTASEEEEEEEEGEIGRASCRERV